MVELRRYGPVLDTTVDVVKELTRHGETELRLPVHPEAAGMAADVQLLLSRLYPYVDYVFYISRGCLYICREERWMELSSIICG